MHGAAAPIEHLLGGELTDHQWGVAQLPTPLGGLGLAPPTEQRAAAAFLAAVS